MQGLHKDAGGCVGLREAAGGCGRLCGVAGGCGGLGVLFEVPVRQRNAVQNVQFE